MKTSILLLSANLVILSTLPAAFVTVAVYDENTTQLNAVDKSDSVYSAAAITADVSTAHTNGFGGVINFDNFTLSNATSFDATYASGAKSISISGQTGINTNAQGFTTSNPNTAQRTPISGAAALNNQGGDVLFEFGSITGGIAGEAVTSAGITILGRNPSVDLLRTYSAFATFSDNSVSTIVSGDYAGNATHDVFVGFTAPAGLGIKSLYIDFENTFGGSFTHLDDLGFITAVVPEPSFYSLVASVGVVGILILRRRRN